MSTRTNNESVSTHESRETRHKGRTQDTQKMRQSRETRRPAWVAIALFLVGFVMFFCASRWVKIGGAIALGGCQIVLLVESFRCGELRTNWGVARRSHRPSWFWLEFGFWCAAAAVFTSALLWHAVGASGAIVSSSLSGGPGFRSAGG